jgi:hypothetical protein
VNEFIIARARRTLVATLSQVEDRISPAFTTARLRTFLVDNRNVM